MSLPVRCFTCNKVIGRFENEYVKIKDNENLIEEFFKNRSISRFCCKRMFMTTSFDIHDQFIECKTDNLPTQVTLGETKKIRHLKAV